MTVKLSLDKSARSICVGGFFLRFSLVAGRSWIFGLVLFATLMAPGVFAPGAAMAQSQNDRNVFYLDLGAAFQQRLNFEYQRVSSDTYSWTVRGMYWNIEQMNGWAIEAAGIGVGVKFHTQGNAPLGGFMGLSVDLAQVNAGTYVMFDVPPDLQTSIYVIPTGSVGYTWFIDYVFVEIGLGMQYFAGGIKPRWEGDDTFPMKGPVFYWTLSVGVPF